MQGQLICFTSITLFSANVFFIGRHELCDYCPSEFQDETEEFQDEIDDEEIDGFKRHHHHRHPCNRVRAEPVSGERRHPKAKRPTTKTTGDYDINKLKRLKLTKSHHREHRQQYKSDDNLGSSNDEVHSTTNPDSAYYGEYKFDDSKMTVEDNGKGSLVFLAGLYVCLFILFLCFLFNCLLYFVLFCFFIFKNTLYVNKLLTPNCILYHNLELQRDLECIF